MKLKIFIVYISTDNWKDRTENSADVVVPIETMSTNGDTTHPFSIKGTSLYPAVPLASSTNLFLLT